VPTVVSHSSLSADERRRAEQTFAEASECVVVATSTLELGVDIGDLDRVVQLDAPNSVSSFLQRLGRTGRRAGTTRNMLFLATTEMGLVQSCAVLSLWGRGFVEPVVPPSTPWHIAAQQFLALALQEGRFSLAEWRQWWSGLEWMSEPVLSHLLSAGFLETDGGFAFVGPEAERRFGRRNFLELTSVFTAAPELKVLHGRAEVGAVSPLALSSRVDGPRLLSLGGRSWQVTHVDWRRRQVFVVPGEGRGRSVWQGAAAVLGPELAGAVGDVLRGADPDVELSARAIARLAAVREKFGWLGEGSTVERDGSGSRWWTFAGSRANASLAAVLEAQAFSARADGVSVTVDSVIGVAEARACAGLLAEGVGPPVDVAALEGLKFSALLSPGIAAEVLEARLADASRARRLAEGPVGVNEDLSE
jgi:ATP-dependent Lhr-like helicase